ncbi:fucose 4-O-acetylase-like acetyltransferase [Pullulanibacillus pueri]|uniref:Putative membrane-bound acyltransferase YkrP n=1 Tax=Pullulanibacillus pueri TaxID=1437324 RepID=A0A8J2ZW33_9BACL|nr:acyltransferase family protein [Pullulanibacillus pueri]MBM7682286.1 fucose 4-O-acetylase-like acetyltransferase [Pullulanibacillus pueri]GGH80942.1 putative membrane-bound acyltransferase YkrP [Pullulanibacillus pueri]
MSRDAYFDNARILLILMVVFGHLISPIKANSDFIYGLYKFIYLFHMPAFILISGYFSKGFNRPGYLSKIVKKTLIPYAIFQIVYCFFYYFTGYESDLSLSLFDPHWSLWFLMSLFCWNLLLKVFAKLPYALPIAFIIGIAIGYVPFFGSYLSIDRTFTFFPLFLLGYMLNNKDFSIFKQKKMTWVSIPALLAIFMVCYFIFPNSLKDWLLCSSSYAQMGYGDWTGGAIRLLFYGAMIVTTFSFLAAVPTKEFSFTKLGGRTLYIYLLHGFFVKTIGLKNPFENFNSFLQYSLLLILAIVLCGLLGSKPIKRLTQPIIEMKKPQFWNERGSKKVKNMSS